MNHQFLKTFTRLTAAVLVANSTLQADTTIPLQLSRPDGKPGATDKPVKVYVLAGQSNMVGMGDITGAQPPHPRIYLAADPTIIPGEMPVGTNRSKSACKWIWRGSPALEKHGLYQKTTGNDTGATVVIHKGAYDPKADYTKLTPAKTETVALGTTAASIPTLDGPCTPVATAFIDVPVTGNYLVHVGFGDSSQAIATLNGTEVYRKDNNSKPTLTKITLEAGKRHPLQITYIKGGSATFWLEQVDLVGKSDLVTLTKKDKKFPYLIDDAGNWTVRNDVYFQEARVAEEGKGSPLSATSNNGKSIGPEVGFGFVMGTHHDEQVLLIKTAMGNRSLGSDFRPPSSGKIDPNSQWEGLEYRLMIKGVRQTLENIDKVVPGYKGQGYEIAGFGWFQGHKDSGSTKEEYEKHLVNLINDLRKEFKSPKMKAVVATVGFHGYRLSTGPWKGVWEAQMAVGDPKQHPEFSGSVASVDTRDFWREVEESPRGQDYHYNRNPETYLLVGEAMGRAMVRMLGGKAEDIPKSDREAKTMAAIAAEAAKPAPTAEQIAASNAAVKPMILDGLLQSFLAEPKNQTALKAVCSPALPMPAKAPEYLEDAVDDAIAFLQAAGISEYDWKPVLPDMRTGKWETFGFNIPNNPYKNKPKTGITEANEEDAEATTPAPKGKKEPAPPALKITLPGGMENWFDPGFDTSKAGWKTAPAPFGVAMEENVPEAMAWIAKYPPYPLKRPMPKTVIDNDVFLMRGTFELPPAKEGHRYRIRLNGSIHDNSGEGYAIYVNGKLIGEQKNGVTSWRKQGPRGSYVWKEFGNDFKGGKVTIAVANFPMSNWKSDDRIPPIGPLSVWIEEQKLPKLGE